VILVGIRDRAAVRKRNAAEKMFRKRTEKESSH
jgi:hypothetical protein